MSRQSQPICAPADMFATVKPLAGETTRPPARPRASRLFLPATPARHQAGFAVQEAKLTTKAPEPTTATVQESR